LTQRDQGVIGVLLAVFVVLGIAVALPTVDARPPSAEGLIAAAPTATPAGTLDLSAAAASIAGGIGASGAEAAADAPSPAPASGGASDAASASPAAPAVLRHGILSKPTSINPLTARTQADRDIVALVFSGLVKLGPGESVVGDLADRWTVDRTGKLWTFHIRDGEHWHDGEPVTADDVVYTIRTLKDVRYTGPLAGSWSEISVKKVDVQTVQFTLRTALGDFLQVARQPLLPAHLLAAVPPEQLADSAFSAAPVGSGPYRLLQWDASMALLERTTVVPVIVPSAAATSSTGNVSPLPSGSAPAPGQVAAAGPASSPGPTGASPVLRLQLLFYADAASLAAAYEAGEIDMANGLPAATARALDESVAATRLVRDPRSTLTAVLLNLRTNHPLSRDQDVRQALLKAIDRVKLVNTVLDAMGRRADSLIPPQSWAFVAKYARPMAYNTTSAAKQLQAAGWRKVNGKWHPPDSKNIFTIELITTTKTANPVAYDAAQFVADSWRSFGITVKVVPLAPNVLVGERLARANFTAAVVDINVGLDPDLYPLLASRQAGIGGSNLSGVQSLVLDELLVAARKPGPIAERRNAWAKLEQFLAQTQVTLPLAFRDDAMVVSDRVIGPTSRLLGDLSDRFWDVLSWRLASAR
jgi:peptide/nickel transport system substrate-binding protein